LLGTLIVAPPLTLTVCELEASRPRPGLDVFVLYSSFEVDTPIFVVECRDSSPGIDGI